MHRDIVSELSKRLDPGYRRDSSTACLTEPMTSRLYFRQLLSGRDFARGSILARRMANFAYLIGDRETKQAVVVDPAYSVRDLLGQLEEDGMTLVGVLATHFHPDHVGGGLMGVGIEGVRQLLDLREVPVHVQRQESTWLRRVTGVSKDVVVEHASGDVVEVGAVPIELVHTPGHTPGSQCFLVGGRLVSGDTLFLEGCGRTDLPGSDPRAMYDSLFGRLARVPDDTVLFPGHLYSAAPSATMGETRRVNYVLAPRTPEQWLRLFGR
jgi:glyoxylase-like metal-dependent hydrolase (beta-lactamase superfamily II)